MLGGYLGGGTTLFLAYPGFRGSYSFPGGLGSIILYSLDQQQEGVLTFEEEDSLGTLRKEPLVVDNHRTQGIQVLEDTLEACEVGSLAWAAS